MSRTIHKHIKIKELMGMSFENPGEGRSICQKIYNVLLIFSSGFNPIQVRNMGYHCAHFDNTRVSAYMIYYRDSTYSSQEREGVKVNIPALGRCTQICWYVKNLDIYW